MRQWRQRRQGVHRLRPRRCAPQLAELRGAARLQRLRRRRDLRGARQGRPAAVADGAGHVGDARQARQLRRRRSTASLRLALHSRHADGVRPEPGQARQRHRAAATTRSARAPIARSRRARSAACAACARAAGGACAVNDDCDYKLVCADVLCVALGAVGASCDGGHPCAQPNVCKAAQCDARRSRRRHAPATTGGKIAIRPRGCSAIRRRKCARRRRSPAPDSRAASSTAATRPAPAAGTASSARSLWARAWRRPPTAPRATAGGRRRLRAARAVHQPRLQAARSRRAACRAVYLLYRFCRIEE